MVPLLFIVTTMTRPAFTSHSGLKLGASYPTSTVMRWTLKSADCVVFNIGKTTTSITAAVSATAMTIAITIHRAPFFGAAIGAVPDDDPDSIANPASGALVISA